MLERISQAQLNSALTVREESLQKSLSRKDSLSLLAMLDSLVRRYPSQDLSASMAEYQRDYKRLCLKYSLPTVLAAVEELRLDPEQTFFPRPEEAAKRIEQRQQVEYWQKQHEATEQRRLQEIKEFWGNLPWMMETTGYSEEEFLSRFPLMRGTKPTAEKRSDEAA
jgi:hypothetical protein